MTWLRRLVLSSGVFGLLAASAATPEPFEPYPLPTGALIMDPAFTRDGQTLYTTLVVKRSAYTIVASTRDGDRWAAPSAVSFSGTWRDLEEVLSPDGATMIFSSNRPVAAGGAAIDSTYYHRIGHAKGGNLWLVHRTASGWGPAMRLPDAINANTSTFSPTLAADGTLYFMRASGPRAAFHLFISRLENGVYRTSSLAPFSDARYDDFDPTIAPDGSFVIFTSTRPPVPAKSSALFIAFFRNGKWMPPQVLGGEAHAVNAVEARLSPDLKTLYYSSKSVLWQSGLSIDRP